MSIDQLIYAAVITLALAVVIAFLVNTRMAVRGGLSAERATLRAERHADLLLACGAALPWVALCSVYALAIRASLALGHWPRPMINDPKSFGWPVHHTASFILAGAASISIFLVFALLVIAACCDIKPAHAKASLLFFAVGYAVFWCVALIDPGQVMEWLAD